MRKKMKLKNRHCEERSEVAISYRSGAGDCHGLSGLAVMTSKTILDRALVLKG